MKWEDGVWPGTCTMPNIGAWHRDENGFVWLPISADSAHPKWYLRLNCGETPREKIPTTLSEVLQENTDEKYHLSPKACRGILNRAAKRGKELPEVLRIALETQANRSNCDSED